ncbi:hypothetical protein QUF90_21430 [Desulfococcaceae bacterium HSG9]|nr:hypothetical protein [Desulfococcaceae bacterium HSG9]
MESENQSSVIIFDNSMTFLKITLKTASYWLLLSECRQAAAASVLGG